LTQIKVYAKLLSLEKGLSMSNKELDELIDICRNTWGSHAVGRNRHEIAGHRDKQNN
jgi:hypothetical protein